MSVGGRSRPAPTRATGRRGLSHALVAEPVLTALRERHPLTVLRGPRGYGKTSTIRLWLEEVGEHERPVLVTLTEAANTADGFWAELRSHLTGVGLQIPDRGDLRWSVVSALAEHQGPLLLILDDFHEAGLHDGATAIDDDLVDVMRQNDRFDLVIGTRTYRTLETSGLLSVDAVVLGPDDLRMTGAMVHALAAGMGVEMTLDDAEQVAVDTGGWPSAIRAGLVRSGGGPGEFDAGLVDDYIINMVTDLRFPSVRAFLLRTAVPERFTADMARLIAPNRNPLRILRNVRAAGLLAERQTVDGKMYSYAPAVREALVRLGRDIEPEMVRDVHHVLMNLAATARDPGGVLSHAIEAGELDTALAVIEREWGSLLAASPLALVDAARRFPADVVAANPRLRIAAEMLEGSPGVDDSAAWPVTAETTFTAELTAHLASPVGSDGEESMALLQWGITCLLVGKRDAAAYAFNRARTLGLVGGGSDETVEMSAIGLALGHALDGEPELALRWLDDPAVTGRLERVHEVDGRDIAVVGAQLARAMALIDAGSDQAGAAIEAMREPGHRDDLWATTVWARALHVASSGDDEQIARMSGEVRAAMRQVQRGTLIETALAGCLVELLIAEESYDVAHQVAARYDSSALSWSEEAQLLLATNRHEEAIAVAQRVIGSTTRTWRSTIESQVVLASAHHALGRDAEAHDAFRHAVRLAHGTGQRRPFRLMPWYLFELWAGDDQRVLALWPDTGRAAEAAGEQEDLPSLTPRELQILRSLESHSGPVGIGQDLNLSVNTVKTHLRAVYRKLGVSGRTEALTLLGRRQT